MLLGPGTPALCLLRQNLDGLREGRVPRIANRIPQGLYLRFQHSGLGIQRFGLLPVRARSIASPLCNSSDAGVA